MITIETAHQDELDKYHQRVVFLVTCLFNNTHRFTDADVDIAQYINETTTTVDRSGNGHHGTINGSMTAADWVTGKICRALDFDGVDDYVQVADADDLDALQFFSCWVNPGAYRAQGGPDFHILISKHTSYGCGLFIDNAVNPNRFACIFEDSAGNVSSAFYNIPTYDAWYLVQGSFNASNKAELFINGATQGQGAAINNALGLGTNMTGAPLRIGGGVAGRYSLVKIDDIGVGITPPASSDLVKMYSSPGWMPLTGLKGHWPLDGLAFDKWYLSRGMEVSPGHFGLNMNTDTAAINFDNVDGYFTSILEGEEIKEKWIEIREASLDDNGQIIGTSVIFLGAVTDWEYEDKSASIKLGNILSPNWQRKTPREQCSPSCQCEYFGDEECQYPNPDSTWCDMSWDRCGELGNQINFHGYRWVSDLLKNPEIWWGRAPKI